MLDILTIQEIELNVAAMAAEREEKFQAALNAPLLRAQLVMDVLENPEVAEELKRSNPAEYARVVANIRRMKSLLSGKG